MMSFSASISRRGVSAPTRAVLARAEERTPTPAAEVLDAKVKENKDDIAKVTGVDPTLPSSEVDIDSGENTTVTNILGRTQELVNGRAAQLGIIFAAVSELATDQTIMQQLSDPNSNSQAYFIATAFLATAATFIPRFVGGEQPEDREQSVWTATAELANGRAAMIGFAALLGYEYVTKTPFF
uniref:Putative early light-inducible protein 3 n=1 Tax=Ulva linza TaxID=63409 RepID=H9BN87_9CHLO|nr:putative early light-inducible protein 3 [Ulva linza]